MEMKEFSQQEMFQFLDKKDTGLLYLYTPMCGTCQTASKILTVLKELIDVPMAQTNLNYAPDLAISLSIESVPCLITVKEGHVDEKIYAFHSVPYLYEKLNLYFNSKEVR
jgi:thioredoxin-like negative regulator of GroEL